jgi:hypothetical protein
MFGISCNMVSKFGILNQGAARHLAANLQHFSLVCVLGELSSITFFYLKMKSRNRATALGITTPKTSAMGSISRRPHARTGDMMIANTSNLYCTI